MVVFNNALAGAAGQSAGGAAAYEVERSLRFNSGDSAYLSRTPASAGNRKTWTWSAWVKKAQATITSDNVLFGYYLNSSPFPAHFLRFENANNSALRFYLEGSSDLVTSQVFRDPSAWYHIVAVWDTTNATADDRHRLYVNGVQVTEFAARSNPAQNTDGHINNTIEHGIGRYGQTASNYFNGYLADVHFIDGLALPPSAFAETDANGVWSPKQYINPNNGTTWSNYVTGTALTGYEATKAFDGDLSTQAIPDRTGTTTPTTLTFTPPSAISGKVGIYFLANTNEDDSATISINGTDVSSTLRAVQAAGGSQPWYYEFDSITSLSSIAWTAETGFDGWNVFGITIDGMLLVDGWNQYNDGTFYSNGATATGGFESANPAPNGFNGVITAANRANGVTTGGTIEIVFNPGIAVTSTVGIWSGKSGLKYQINDSGSYTSYTDAVEAWKDISFSGTLTNLKIQHASSNEAPGFSGIRVDGTTLVDTGTVGRNSFHLKFNDASSPAALGTDSANGNDWTVNNIQTGTRSYVGDYSASAGFQTTAPAINAFDGNTSTRSASNNASSTVTFSPNPGITVTDKIEVYTREGTITVNGGSAYTSSSTAAYKDVSSVSPATPFTLTSLVVTGTPSNAGEIFAIKIDGVELIDSFFTDSLFDSPTNGNPSVDTGLGGELSGNYCTWLPITEGGASTSTFSQGNLTCATSSSATTHIRGTFAFPTSGKWYVEVTYDSGTYGEIGVVSASADMLYPGYLKQKTESYTMEKSGNLVGTNSGTSTGSGSSYTSGDTIGIALDLDNQQLRFWKNGTQLGGFNSVTNTVPLVVAFSDQDGGSSTQATLNAGQRAFAYSAPSGFKALCTANLPTPTIEDGSAYMDVALYTGNSSTQTISGLGFSPDFVWVKARTTGSWHFLSDIIRGGTKTLASNDAASEGTRPNHIQSWNSDGFTLGADGTSNDLNVPHVAWTWDAGSSTVSNTDGTGTTNVSVRANQSAGFSIVTYTGGSSTPANSDSGQSFGHGLGVAPQLVICKKRTGANSWPVYHASTALGALVLDGTNALDTTSYLFAKKHPSSSVVYLGNNPEINNSSHDYVAYCFAPVEGYSAFGTSPRIGFVYTGHRPRFVLLRTLGSGNWVILDSARGETQYLLPDDSGTEFASTQADFTANGFNLKTSIWGATNDIIWASFAENPFKYARAR